MSSRRTPDVLRRALDGRRAREADILYRQYVRPAGRGLHVVRNIHTEQEIIVSSLAGSRTFRPGAVVPTGSNTGHPGEAILGLPPAERQGGSRTGFVFGQTRDFGAVPDLDPGAVAFIGFSTSPLSEANEGTHFTLFQYNSSGGIIEVLEVERPTVSGTTIIGPAEVWPQHDAATLRVPVMSFEGDHPHVYLAGLLSLEDGSFVAVPTTGLPSITVTGDEELDPDLGSDYHLVYDAEEGAWYETVCAGVSDPVAGSLEARLAIRKITGAGVPSQIWAKTVVASAGGVTQPRNLVYGSTWFFELEDWDGEDNILVTKAGAESVADPITSASGAGASGWLPGASGPQADDVVYAQSTLGTFLLVGDAITFTDVWTGGSFPENIWTLRPDGTLLCLEGATTGDRTSLSADLSSGSYPITPTSAGITFAAHTVEDYDGMGTPLTFAPLCVYEV